MENNLAGKMDKKDEKIEGMKKHLLLLLYPCQFWLKSVECRLNVCLEKKSF